MVEKSGYGSFSSRGPGKPVVYLPGNVYQIPELGQYEQMRLPQKTVKLTFFHGNFFQRNDSVSSYLRDDFIVVPINISACQSIPGTFNVFRNCCDVNPASDSF